MGERSYHIGFNSGSGTEIGKGRIKNVLAILNGNRRNIQFNRSRTTYSIGGGEVVYQIGPATVFIVRSSTEEGLVRIARHVGLTLAG